MILYHGTVEAYIPQIMKVGLEPCPEHAWLAKGTGIATGQNLTKSESRYVYLTMDENFAAEIAIAKAEYLALKPGKESGVYHLVKDMEAPVLKTTPVLLKVTVPDKFAKSHFEVDPHSLQELGLRYVGVIPAKYLSRTGETRLKQYEKQIKELEAKNAVG